MPSVSKCLINNTCHTGADLALVWRGVDGSSQLLLVARSNLVYLILPAWQPGRLQPLHQAQSPDGWRRRARAAPPPAVAAPAHFLANSLAARAGCAASGSLRLGHAHQQRDTHLAGRNGGVGVFEAGGKRCKG